MIIDSHMHLIRKKNINLEAFEKLRLRVPEDTELDSLIGWLKSNDIKKAVVMGQDMSKVWKTTFGEDYLLESYRKYPDFLIPLASLEPIDEVDRFNKNAFEYFEKSIMEYGFRGLLLTPPYGQYYSNDRKVYPFYQKAQELNVVVQFHHSAQKGPAILAHLKYANLSNLNDIIIDFPDLKIVIEHLAYPYSEQLFVLMNNSKNLWTDLAMTFERTTWLAWNLVLAKEYGVIDRIMYGSDYVAYNYDYYSKKPADDFKKYIDFIKNGLNNVCKKCGWPTFSIEELEGLLGKNAACLYKLS